MSERETAIGDLGLVQEFVNTIDLQDGPELLTDQNTLRDWLVARRLLNPDAPVGADDFGHAIAVREAMRSVIGGNSGMPVYPVDVATLNEAATASRLRMRFGPGGKARLEPEAVGAVGALGKLVASLYSAMQSEDWERLKLCSSDSCRWAFYDRSKNHSSRWCTMASCGNRAKARRFRQKNSSPRVRPSARASRNLTPRTGPL
jgi:predicted RNA-binding Zn ribbon-like protein